MVRRESLSPPFQELLLSTLVILMGAVFVVCNSTPWTPLAVPGVLK